MFGTIDSTLKSTVSPTCAESYFLLLIVFSGSGVLPFK